MFHFFFGNSPPATVVVAKGTSAPERNRDGGGGLCKAKPLTPFQLRGDAIPQMRALNSAVLQGFFACTVLDCRFRFGKNDRFHPILPVKSNAHVVVI